MVRTNLGWRTGVIIYSSPIQHAASVHPALQIIICIQLFSGLNLLSCVIEQPILCNYEDNEGAKLYIFLLSEISFFIFLYLATMDSWKKAKCKLLYILAIETNNIVP